MTVFITKRPVSDRMGWVPDLSAANTYGPMEFIFEGHERVFALPMPSLHKARRSIGKNFNYERDFLLHPNSLDQMALICCLTAILDQRPPYINILYYDRAKNEDGTRNQRSGTYYPIKLELFKQEARTA